MKNSLDLIILIKSESFLSFREKYGKNIPDEEREKLYEMIDKELYNGFNPELISLIDGFFRDNTVK